MWRRTKIKAAPGIALRMRGSSSSIEEATIVRIRCRSPASRRFAHTAARVRRVRSALWGRPLGGKRAVELVRVDHSVSYPCVFEPSTDLERQRRLSDPSGAGDQARG